MQKLVIIFPALLFVLTIFFGSCEKTEDIVDFPVKDPTLVLNCYFSPDTDWVFEVSKSLSVIDNAELDYIKNASIKLFENNIQIAEVKKESSDGLYYIYGHRPKAGNEYSIEASHAKYPSIKATDKLANKVDFNITRKRIIDSFTYYDPFQGISYGNMKGNITLKINDPAKDENYYRIQMIYYDSALFIKSRYVVWGISSSNPAVERAYYDGLLVSDYMFDGQSYEISFDFEDWEYRSDKEYFISIESMSKARYFYERSLALYWDRQGNPFAEPVQVYNNIKNGYGIFAGFVVEEKLLKF